MASKKNKTPATSAKVSTAGVSDDSIAPAPPRTSHEVVQLVLISEAIIDAASRTESAYWQAQLEARIADLLAGGIKSARAGITADKTLMAALEYADEQFSAGVAETLAEACESVATSCVINISNSKVEGDVTTDVYQATLFTIPIIAWTKYQIAEGAFANDTAAKIEATLRASIMSPDTLFAINPFLSAIDQIPQTFCETRTLLQTMVAALINDTPHIAIASEATTTHAKADAAPTKQARHKAKNQPRDAVFPLPADARFIIGVALSKRNCPAFQWQDGLTIRKSQRLTQQDIFNRWITESRALFSAILPGCEFEIGLPNAFFHNCRESDIRVRPHRLRAVFSLSKDLLNTSVGSLGIVIAGVGAGTGPDEIDEYRISITYKGQDDVLNGALWPLFGAEEANLAPLPIEAIQAIVHEQQWGEVTVLEGIHPAEYCEDCGAPFFFNHHGEATHPFMPDDIEMPDVNHYH